MTLSITAPSESKVKTLLCLPIRVPTSAIRCLSQKVQHVFQKVIGYFLRVIVFMFGEYKTSWFKRQLIEWYKGGLYDTRGRCKFDPARLERTREIFIQLGCPISQVKTPDGNADIEYAKVSYKAVKAKIEESGGCWTEIKARKTGEDRYKQEDTSKQSIEVIYQNPGTPSDTWDKFRTNVISKFGLPEILLDINGKKVPAFLAGNWDAEQKRPKEGLCFVRAHSPTSSWAMEIRGFIAFHLFKLHADLYLFDPRGTYNSVGKPTEGGCYLDAETIYQEAMKTGEYREEDMFASGFCLGGAIITKLVELHPKMNLVLENSFNSMRQMVQNYAWPGNRLGPYGIPSLLSSLKSITSRVTQDGFDTLGKIKKLPLTDALRIFINTFPDKIVPADAHDQLIDAAKKTGNAFSLRHHTHPHHKNGHSLDPLFEDEKLAKRYIDIIAGHTAV